MVLNAHSVNSMQLLRCKTNMQIVSVSERAKHQITWKSTQN